MPNTPQLRGGDVIYSPALLGRWPKLLVDWGLDAAYFPDAVQEFIETINRTAIMLAADYVHIRVKRGKPLSANSSVMKSYSNLQLTYRRYLRVTGTNSFTFLIRMSFVPEGKRSQLFYQVELIDLTAPIL